MYGNAPLLSLKYMAYYLMCCTVILYTTNFSTCYLARHKATSKPLLLPLEIVEPISNTLVLIIKATQSYLLQLSFDLFVLHWDFASAAPQV